MATYLDLSGNDAYFRSIRLNDEGTETCGAYGWRVLFVEDRIAIWREFYGHHYPPETLRVEIIKNSDRSYFFERSTTSKADQSQ